KITADPNTADTMTNAAARKWLTDQSASPEVLASYDRAVQEQARQRTQDAKEEFNDLIGLYNQSSLTLLPQNYPLSLGGFLGFNGWLPGSRFFGMLGAAMLLTLGAPFWFNLLKSLASLRSQVSEKIDQESTKK